MTLKPLPLEVLKEQSQHTIKYWGTLWERNAKFNKGVGVQLKDIEGGYRPYEVILVGFSPSLEGQLKYLKNLDRLRFRIVCVDVAFKYLMDNGIIPDVVFSVDAGIDSDTVHYENGKEKYDTSKIMLVAKITSSFKFIEDWKGPKALFNTQDTEGYWQKIFQITNCRNMLATGGNVSTCAFCWITDVMEAKRLILIGQEHSWEHWGKDRVGAKAQKITKKKIKKLQKNAKKGDLSTVQTVLNMYGKTVFTTGEYLRYAQWFEMMVRKAKKNVYDCSKGGILGGPNAAIKKADLNTLLTTPFEAGMADFESWLDMATRVLPPDIISILKVDSAPKGFKVFTDTFKHTEDKKDEKGIRTYGADWEDKKAEKIRVDHWKELFKDDIHIIKVEDHPIKKTTFKGKGYIIPCVVGMGWSKEKLSDYIEKEYVHGQGTLSQAVS